MRGRSNVSAGFSAVLLSAALTSTAWAGGTFAPFSMDSAGVLPQGIRSVRVVGFSTEIENRWDGFGGSEVLAAKFNRPVSYNELVDVNKSASERAQLRGYLQSKGVDMQSAVGDSRGVVNTRLTSTVPVLAYGITNRITAAVIIPVVYSKMNVSTGWSASPSLQKNLDEMSTEGKHNQKLTFEERMQNLTSTKLAAYGYKPLENETHQEIGDVTLAAKIQVLKDDIFAVAVAPKLVLPTGRSASVEKLIDIAPGDGQTDIGLGVTGEAALSRDWSLVSSVSVLRQLSSRRAKRIPLEPYGGATPDIDFDVEEKLGDIYAGGFGAKYRLAEAWTLGTQYSIQYKEADDYKGSAFSGDRYAWMSLDTEQVLESAQLGVTFSTVPMYRAGRFAAPLETTLSVATTLGGRNTNKLDLVSWELALFF